MEVVHEHCRSLKTRILICIHIYIYIYIYIYMCVCVAQVPYCKGLKFGRGSGL